MPADFFKDYNPNALECILGKLADEPDGRARDITGVASTCKAFNVAAHLAVTAHRRECYEHTSKVFCGAAATGGVLYPFFVNEAAYYEKGCAFMLGVYEEVTVRVAKTG